MDSPTKVNAWKEIASLILLDPDTWKNTLLFANLGTNKFPTVELLKRKVAFFEDPKIVEFTVKNLQVLVPKRVYRLNGVEYKVQKRGRDLAAGATLTVPITVTAKQVVGA